MRFRRALSWHDRRRAGPACSAAAASGPSATGRTGRADGRSRQGGAPRAEPRVGAACRCPSAPGATLASSRPADHRDATAQCSRRLHLPRRGRLRRPPRSRCARTPACSRFAAHGQRTGARAVPLRAARLSARPQRCRSVTLAGAPGGCTVQHVGTGQPGRRALSPPARRSAMAAPSIICGRSSSSAERPLLLNENGVRMSQWEIVIGLETHAQLRTQSKIFSGAATAFGAEPNSQACAVDIALPGVLPVLNREAVVCAIKFGLAVGARSRRARSSPARTTSTPTCPRATRSASSRCRSSRAAG